MLGIGARRVEITEEHKTFYASTVYFRAGSTQARRNVSIGPGAADYTSSEVRLRNLEETAILDHNVPSIRNRHADRRLSADNSFFQRTPLSHEEFLIAPTPPYSRASSVTQPSSPLLTSSPDIMENHPSQSLGEYSDYLDSDLRTRIRESLSLHRFLLSLSLFSGRSTGLTRSPSNIHSLYPELPLSRRPSVEGVPENEPSRGTLRRSSTPSRSTSRPRTPLTPISSVDDNRGRRSSRFSRTSAFVDALQPNLTIGHGFVESRESSHEGERSRGRPQEKGKDVDRMITRPRGSEDRSTFRKIGALFKLDRNDNQAGDRWKEFKKGSGTLTHWLFHIHNLSYIQGHILILYPTRYLPTLLLHYYALTAQSPGVSELLYIAQEPSHPNLLQLAKSSS
jgi:hypothetical protein